MTDAEKLVQIKEILTRPHKTHAFYNLEGVVMDVENRNVNETALFMDDICLDTIKRVQQQISAVLRVLES